MCWVPAPAHLAFGGSSLPSLGGFHGRPVGGGQEVREAVQIIREIFQPDLGLGTHEPDVWWFTENGH